MSIYLDKSGRRWVRVAETAAGVYAWFRPLARADDGNYDRSFKVAEMTALPGLPLNQGDEPHGN